MDRWLQLALLACLTSGILAEDGGEGEEEIPKADVMVAGMLLASVTYMMFTLGMANQKDRALKKLTWTALHTKISIFCAVLLYQGVVALVGQHGSNGVNDGTLRQMISAGFGFFFWFALLQFLMASLSFEIFSLKIWQKEGEEQEEWEERREVLMEFWGVLLGHITGFASITFWANLQIGFYTAYHNTGAFLIILIAICVQMIWVIFVRRTRRELVAKYDPNAEEICEDGTPKISKFAKIALERWNEKTIETENDSMALTLSFLIVQAIRVFVTSVMPDPEGLEERRGPAETGRLEHTHTIAQCFLMLLLGGLTFAAVLVWRDWKALASCKEWLEKKCHESDVDFERITEVASDTGSMILAWSLFFFWYWFLDTLNRDMCRPLAGSNHTGDANAVGLNCGSGGMTGGILLAMCTTVMAYFTIFLARKTARHLPDGVNPNHHESKTAHDIILSVMKASGLLIGFGWEKAFDKAVEDLSEEAGRFKGVIQFAMSLWVFAVVGVIWMWYILPTVMEYGEDDDTKRELREKFKVIHHDKEGESAGSRSAGALQSFLGVRRSDPSKLLYGFVKGVKKNKLEAAKDEFENDLKEMQEQFEKHVEKTRKKFQTLREKKYHDTDSDGCRVNTGKSRADHKNHMRHLLRLQKEAAEYRIVGGDIFKTRSFSGVDQSENPGPSSEKRSSRIAATPYLVTNP